jgi:3-methyladenine DNA glycosylase AlkC
MSDLKAAYDLDYVTRLAKALGADETFVDSLWPMLDSLEMKARTIAIADAVYLHSGSSFDRSGRVLDALFEKGDWKGLDAWPLITVIERHGLESFDASMSLLQKWTHAFSGEFAVRPFLSQDFDLCVALLTTWASDGDHHVRRLVSEGTRPRLPWGQNVKSIDDGFEVIVELISPLRLDESEYVRRSVANHLNDWSKIHPEKVKELVQKWGDGAEEVWVRKHALRSLVKSGDAGALRMLGFSGVATLSDFQCSSSVAFPGALEFEATLTNSTPSRITFVLDFAIEHQGSSGVRAAKVFKWRNLSLAPGESKTIKKRHVFKKITTRRYYDGAHTWSLHGNGVELGRSVFELTGVV